VAVQVGDEAVIVIDLEREPRYGHGRVDLEGLPAVHGDVVALHVAEDGAVVVVAVADPGPAPSPTLSR